jgi:hypothetical protein
MARFRALKDLQASALGLVKAGQEFDLPANVKSIIGWHVEAADPDAQAMIDERTEALLARGERGPGGVGDRRLPTRPFPEAIMNQMASSGMSAPKTVNQTLSVLPEREQGMLPAPADSSPMHPAPRRRRAAT